MKKNCILLLLLLFVAFTNASAQSAYTFTYNINKPGNNITYHTFLVRNNDGSGLVRIRYSLPGNEEDILTEAFIDEFNPPGKNDEPDTSLLIIKAVNLSYIQGNDKVKFEPPSFVFRYNSQNKFFEPAGVSYENNYAISPSVSFQWAFHEGTALNKDIVSLFFSDDEDFYINLFRPVTRSLSPAEKNIKMHLMIVADTNDATIGKAVSIDINRVTELFSSICSYLGIKLNTTILAGKNFGKANTASALTRLQPAPNDIVIFYYSGHGFRVPEKPRAFPNMKLKNVKTPRTAYRDSLTWAKASRTANISQSLNIADVFQTITRKGARMNLVISDCCNDDIFSVNFKSTKPSGTKNSNIKWSEQNLRALFLDSTPLSILTTACTETETSASQADFGSFYTYFFKSSLESHCSILKNNVSWDSVIKQANTQTTIKASNTYCSKPRIPANLCKQNPVYRILIGKNPKLSL